MITSHKQSIHMTIKKNIPLNNNLLLYTCDQCEYVTDTESMLTTHEQSKHEENIEKRNYMCLFCDYETDQKDIINVHIQNCD